MLVWPEKWQTENVLPVTVKKIFSYGLGKSFGQYAFILIHPWLQKDKFSQHFRKISETLKIYLRIVNYNDRVFKICYSKFLLGLLLKVRANAGLKIFLYVRVRIEIIP